MNHNKWIVSETSKNKFITNNNNKKNVETGMNYYEEIKLLKHSVKNS